MVGFNEETIRMQISYEIQRNGQIYFINNRIENIKEIAGYDSAFGAKSTALVTGKWMAKTRRIDVGLYERRIRCFGRHHYHRKQIGCAECNTIFINNANNFGLSDLHQMRGRVGRSNKKHFVISFVRRILQWPRKPENASNLGTI